jgi:hypothetical protein
MVTLKQLCTELKLDPREARERLRLAVRDTRKNPELAKSHKPGHGWEWPKNSIALKEARIALSLRARSQLQPQFALARQGKLHTNMSKPGLIRMVPEVQQAETTGRIH